MDHWLAIYQAGSTTVRPTYVLHIYVTTIICFKFNIYEISILKRWLAEDEGVRVDAWRRHLLNRGVDERQRIRKRSIEEDQDEDFEGDGEENDSHGESEDSEREDDNSNEE
jgi:hypothetical protein